MSTLVESLLSDAYFADGSVLERVQRVVTILEQASERAGAAPTHTQSLFALNIIRAILGSTASAERRLNDVTGSPRLSWLKQHNRK